MERKCKAIIHRLSFPLGGCMNYNVSLLYEWHNTYVYTGHGRFFRTAEEAERYAAENANAGIAKDY